MDAGANSAIGRTAFGIRQRIGAGRGAQYWAVSAAQIFRLDDLQGIGQNWVLPVVTMLETQLRQNTTMWALLVLLYAIGVGNIIFAPEVVSLITIALSGVGTAAAAVAFAELWMSRSEIRSELQLEGQNDDGEDLQHAARLQVLEDWADCFDGKAACQRRAAENLARAQDNHEQALRDQGKYGRRAHGSADMVPRIDEACEVARDPGLIPSSNSVGRERLLQANLLDGTAVVVGQQSG